VHGAMGWEGVAEGEEEGDGMVWTGKSGQCM
jgi:hypothetical protein